MEGFKSPREAIKIAFQQSLAEDGKQWLQALGVRNLTVHIYNETQAQQIEGHILLFHVKSTKKRIIDPS